MIRRSRLHLVVALLLPLLALKALLPAGYMASADHGQLRIVMCSAGLAALDDGTPDPDAPPAEHAVCAFAMAGLAAPPPAVTLALLAARPYVATISPAWVPDNHGLLRRAQSPRAPPGISATA